MSLFPSEDIDLVMIQAHAIKQVAYYALERKIGDTTNAITYINNELSRIYVSHFILPATGCLHYVDFYFSDGGNTSGALMSDNEIKEFLSLHPTTIIDEYGCGMDHLNRYL